MMYKVLMRIIRKIIRMIGESDRVEIYRSIEGSTPASRLSILDRRNTVSVLVRLKQLGLEFATVIDIGGFNGEWSKEVSSVLPSAKYIIVEPQEEKTNLIAQNVSGLSYQVFTDLLGSEVKEQVNFYLMESGSSVKKELTNVSRKSVMLTQKTLDSLFGHADFQRPILMKLDVQGSELDVLSGGKEVLSTVDAVIAEVPLVVYNEGAPLIADFFAQMKEFGFLVYELMEEIRRLPSNELTHVDVCFLRKDSFILKRLNDFSEPFNLKTAH